MTDSGRQGASLAARTAESRQGQLGQKSRLPFAERLRRRRPNVRAAETRDAYMLLLPWIMGFLAWTLGPMLFSLFLAFARWDIIGPIRWVGTANFASLFEDKYFYISFKNTAFMVAFGVPLRILVALCLALALNQKLKGMNLYRTIFYLPSVTPLVASSIIWMWILNPEFGILNMFLRKLGFGTLYWLADPRLAKPAFILMSLWGVGTTMVILLAGLQSIPEHLYEAASMDGAGRWKRFRHVTLPMLSPTIFFVLVMGVIGMFQIFTSAFVMTGGGPQHATLFYELYLYESAFMSLKFGYASALAWFLFIVIFLLTRAQFWASRRWVYYEAG